jgi:hypothetical protein
MFVRKVLLQPGMRAVVFPAFPHSLTPCALAIPTDSICYEKGHRICIPVVVKYRNILVVLLSFVANLD